MADNGMDGRHLKLATRKLLERFSSLEQAASHCRVKPTNLSQYQSFEHNAFMPVDVAMSLEREIGEPILSAEIARLHGVDWPSPDGSVRDEALDVPVAVGELLAFIQFATSPSSEGGKLLTENEKRRYFELRRQVEVELRELDSAVELDGSLPARRRRATDRT